jgi:hypothetical protein
MSDKKAPILDPKRELPAPHDMELEPGYDDELPARTGKPVKKKTISKWLLLLVLFLILLLAGGMYFLSI